MPALGSDQCWQIVGSVDIGPAAAALSQVKFVPANVGSTNSRKCPCHVVPPGYPLPRALEDLVDTAIGILGGETQRFLFRKLMPGQGMAPHTDELLPAETGWRRFQVPIVSDPAIIMCWPEDDEGIHLAPGIIYEVRVNRLHSVVNCAKIERVHLQIDQTGATV